MLCCPGSRLIGSCAVVLSGGEEERKLVLSSLFLYETLYKADSILEHPQDLPHVSVRRIQQQEEPSLRSDVPSTQD